MDIIIVLFFILLITSFLKLSITRNFTFFTGNYVWTLLIFHILFSATYLLYALSSRSDSVQYYNVADSSNWLDLFKTGTPFISFVAAPFVKYLGLSYFAAMLLFAYFGFLAVLLFYLVAKENVSLPPLWNGLSFIEIVFLLPNLHFWSGSIGKGSVILLGLGLFTYGLSRFNRRLFWLILGGFIVYMVRPHILFTLIVSALISIVITTKGLRWYFRWTMIAAGALLFYLISDSVLQFTNSESLDVLSSNNIIERAAKLSTATSGVDINNYNIFFKMFTFWFRPLFFDGLGVLGLIVSFENAFYLFMLWVLVRQLFLQWGQWNALFRICLISFLLGSFILAQVSGNLGIAMRQKSQMMPFFFIIFFKAVSLRDISQLKMAQLKLKLKRA